MKITDDSYPENERELYSHSRRPKAGQDYTDISSHSSGRSAYGEDGYDLMKRRSPAQRSAAVTERQRREQQARRRAAAQKRKKAKRKKRLIALAAVLLSLILIFCGCFYAYAYALISKVPRTPLDSSDLGITTNDYAEVKNIALLGLDTREDNNVGRSDAIVILTVDKKHRKLKLTSIARDSYVAIDGHKMDKLTHAYAYGKNQLAVKTLNQNFNLEITDYATVNFFEFSKIIDFAGGVTVDVDQAEMTEMNTNIIPWLGDMGIPCESIAAPGVQHLSGAQAVSYARIRHTDNDIERGNRQKEVLSGLFAQVKKMNPLKLPKLAAMIAEECETSLSTNDILSMGMWAVFLSPTFEQLSIPNDRVPSNGKTIGGVWYYVYDLKAAQDDIRAFITEQNTAADPAQ